MMGSLHVVIMVNGIHRRIHARVMTAGHYGILM
jgi:hypothetical protein